MARVELTIPPEPEHVRTARLVAGAAARSCGVAEELLDEVRLAVGEACARAAIRHQTHAPGKDVSLLLRDEETSFTVEVHDATPPSIAEADAGMALALIRSLAPQSAVDPEGSGTVIRMTWQVEETHKRP